MASGTGDTIDEAIRNWASQRFAERHQVTATDPDEATEGERRVTVKLVRTDEQHEFTVAAKQVSGDWVVRDV
ncbi:hypothetical protein [Halomarina litorea]|uniref:hypothetical protein n=1 Tax=Halomarina litorea TaxID=2961595 RepID=UPI0020C2D511|nr:hypothetical protein [Halomarina sp. BCD28]